MKYFFSLLFILVLAASCNQSSETAELKASLGNDKTKTTKEESAEATFVHTVFFWMKENFSKEEADLFESELEKLGKTPSIHSFKWGKPAGTPREVVDNSYTYALIIDFLNTADQDAYQVDPIHLKFIDNCKDLWTKVQVYDTILNQGE